MQKDEEIKLGKHGTRYSVGACDAGPLGIYVHPDLASSNHVLLGRDAVKARLTPSYDGPRPTDGPYGSTLLYNSDF